MMVWKKNEGEVSCAHVTISSAPKTAQSLISSTNTQGIGPMLHGAQGGDILRRVVVRASRSVLPTQPLLRQFSGTSALKRNRDSSLTTQLAEHGLGDDAGTRKPVLSEQQVRSSKICQIHA